MSFKDHFSRGASDYARYRPTYPDELFDLLASHCAKRDLAWDCGTGSGQAAFGLASRFGRVIATDASAAQIAEATRGDRIDYAVALAELVPIRSRSVDLVTSAVAVHWFDRPRFYREVARVLDPEGIVAVWCYGVVRIEPVIDARIDDLYSRVVGPYWPPDRRFVDEEYRTIEFPFDEIELPRIDMRGEMSLDDLRGYLGTWSATRLYVERLGADPIARFVDEIEPLWGAQHRRECRWKLAVRAGRLPGAAG